MRYNLHTHTYRCHHATGTDREYVEAAIQAGIRVLGFADHCPQFFPTDYYSNFRMRPEEAEEYVESLRALQKEYQKDIRILIGFETEYYPALFEDFMRFIEPLKLDYLIMGQHFIRNEYEVQDYYASRATREQAEEYVRQTLEGLSSGVFTYFAHPDILRHEDSTFYRNLMRDFCQQIKAMDIPLEYKILGYRNKKWYPNPAFWQVVAEVGNKVVLGYDAHQPEALAQEQVYDACLGYLNALGIKPVPFDEITLRKPKRPRRG